MRVKHHFCCDSSRSLTDALERNGIPCEHAVWDGIRPETVTFDLYEDSAAFGEITALAGSGDVQSREYTQQELLDAEWLTMRCFHSTLDLVREEEAFAFLEPFGDGKYRHRELVGTTFYLKKPVKWGKRHFVSDGSLGNQHLFCDPLARSILENGRKSIHLLWPSISTIMEKELLQNISPVEMPTAIPVFLVKHEIVNAPRR